MSAYYRRRSGGRSARAVEDERLLDRIRELHAANYYAYGYRRMWLALRRAGEQVPRCRVQRLMKTNGIVGAKRRGKPWRTTKADPYAARRPGLVQRDFSASGANELWVADLSYLRCWQGLVFFAFVLDAYSRMIVGWARRWKSSSPRNAPAATQPNCLAAGRERRSTAATSSRRHPAQTHRTRMEVKAWGEPLPTAKDRRQPRRVPGRGRPIRAPEATRARDPGTRLPL